MQPMLISTRLPGVHNYTCKCGYELAKNGKEFIFLEMSHACCPKCKNAVEAWKHVLDCIDSNPMPALMNTILDFANFKGIVGKINIKPFAIASLNFTSLGVPEDALILDVVYTVHSTENEGYHVFPQEMHGNIPNRKFVPHQVDLYGYVAGLEQVKCSNGKFGSDASVVDTTELIKISYQVKFVENSDYNLAVNYLNKATKAFAENDIEQCIINSAISAETSVSNICRAFWTNHFDAKKIKSLFKATDSRHRLSYYLKLAADEVGLKIKNRKIITSLCDLAEKRNEIMHSGGMNEVAKYNIKLHRLITSAFFIEGYSRILIDKLQSESKP